MRTLKTNDGFEIKAGEMVYDKWGQSRYITGITDQNSAYTICADTKGDVRHEAGKYLYGSEKNALNNHLEWVTRKAWEAEQQAHGWREQETKMRLRIVELEKKEEEKQQGEEMEEIVNAFEDCD